MSKRVIIPVTSPELRFVSEQACTPVVLEPVYALTTDETAPAFELFSAIYRLFACVHKAFSNPMGGDMWDNYDNYIMTFTVLNVQNLDLLDGTFAARTPWTTNEAV